MVVVTDQSTAEATRIDNFCHSHNIAFVRAEIRGVFASLFCDFGSSFTVFDTDGEEPVLNGRILCAAAQELTLLKLCR